MRRRDCARMVLRVPRKYARDARGRFVSLMQMLQASVDLPLGPDSAGRLVSLEVTRGR